MQSDYFSLSYISNRLRTYFGNNTTTIQYNHGIGFIDQMLVNGIYLIISTRTQVGCDVQRNKR